MNNSSNCDLSGNILLRSCRPGWPEWVCYLANISSLTSTVVWFLVLLPQVFKFFEFTSGILMITISSLVYGTDVYRSGRHRSVAGVSPWWAIANFTAAFNNSFFVFFFKCLPISAFITAVYMPTLEIIMLIEFYIFTPQSVKKNMVAAVCVVIWVTMIVVQSSFDVYRQMEWASIVLWSIETFPQVFLNTQRKSTHGLSNGMVTLAAIGKTSDFMSTYLLIIPVQYVIMAWFSSTVAQIGTIQVLWYWNQVPLSEIEDEKAETKKVDTDEVKGKPVLVRQHTSTTCNFLRTLGLAFFSLELILFDVAIVWRMDSFLYLLFPLFVYSLVTGVWAWYNREDLKARLCAVDRR